MYDFYGIYSACRNAAWNCQLDFSTRALPISLIAIAHCAGISIKKNSDTNELRPDELGASIFINGRWIIVYDDTLDKASARMVIAHEMGHIFLGHEYKYAFRRFESTDKKIKSEREADMFAVRLLAPACVLHELGITSPDAIAELCLIPHETAVKRAQRMRSLEARQRFYTSELEAKVADGFSDFIKSYKNFLSN